VLYKKNEAQTATKGVRLVKPDGKKLTKGATFFFGGKKRGSRAPGKGGKLQKKKGPLEKAMNKSQNS